MLKKKLTGYMCIHKTFLNSVKLIAVPMSANPGGMYPSYDQFEFSIFDA